MSISPDEARELAAMFPGTERADEAGVTYFRIPHVTLPEGCSPSPMTLLLCQGDRLIRLARHKVRVASLDVSDSHGHATTLPVTKTGRCASRAAADDYRPRAFRREKYCCAVLHPVASRRAQFEGRPTHAIETGQSCAGSTPGAHCRDRDHSKRPKKRMKDFCEAAGFS